MFHVSVGHAGGQRVRGRRVRRANAGGPFAEALEQGADGRPHLPACRTTKAPRKSLRRCCSKRSVRRRRAFDTAQSSTEPGDPRQLEASRRMEGLRAERERYCLPLRRGDEDGVLPPASKRRSRRILDTSTAYPQLDSPLGFPRTWRSGPHPRDTWRRAGLTGSAPLTRRSGAVLQFESDFSLLPDALGESVNAPEASETDPIAARSRALEARLGCLSRLLKM